MAKFELKFYNANDLSNIKTFENDKLIIIISKCIHSGNEVIIELDKSTAIKFAKTLRTEINKITESEVKNE